MKNTIKLFGIIAVIAIIGFSFAACTNGSTDEPGPLDGTWVGDNLWQFIFTGSDFTVQVNSGGWKNRLKGTFAVSGTDITFNCTHEWNGSSLEWDICYLTDA